jgi:uncharacterized membrane protein
MKENLYHFLTLVEFAISIISIAVVLYGTIIAAAAFIKIEIWEFRSEKKTESLMTIRADFGVYLLLGLELLIAADIITTILNPELEELAVLGGIVLLRTILSVFLERELKDLNARK